MKKLNYLLLLTTLITWSCGSNQQKQEVQQVAEELASETKVKISLEKKWETDTTLTTNESVLYDAGNNILYVSNINGTPTDKDGNGFISRVNLDGTIDNLQWVTGLDAPKGMGISGDKLYVTNITELVEINLADGTISNRYEVEGAQFLNDVAVADGNVYFSDSNTNKIHLLSNGEISTWMEGETLKAPNGLLVEEGHIMLASMGTNDFKSINTTNKEERVLADGIGAGDGVVAHQNGNYIVSNWQGEVYYITKEGDKQLILNTKEQKINSADIEYVKEYNLLLVPTFFNNTVVAYEVKL
ncbi:gluconolaconase [Fulvivirgaceae bacterium BMA10]|uniref:Gluconolaconase n=1 Tax=Splendidivirga corallicola TaxID=3051826 RepID=A0ABT8KRT4_9BACT|nr:gluconolaconase [Fulvivirgaceae bacterium BMA10]